MANKNMKTTKKSKAAEKQSVETAAVTKSAGPTMSGLVVSAGLPKTVTVIIERYKMHPLYRKSFKQSKRYLVHDEMGVKVGDVVEIGQIKPMSKNKHFKVLRVVGQDIATIITEQIKEEAAEAIAEVMPEEEEKLEVATENVEAVKEAESKPAKKGGRAKK